MYSFFRRSLEKGQRLSTSKIRARRKEIENKFNVSPRIAKQLAKSCADDEQVAILLKAGPDQMAPIQFFLDAGLALHDMKVASAQAAHVVRSVRDLGNANKIQASEIELNETIRRAITLTHNLLINIDLKFETDTEGTIHANSGDLVQVWLNLIKNACESLKNGEVKHPKIKIKTWEDEHSWFVEVCDNGPGIPREILPRIFQPNVTTKVDGLSFGLGLGLSILKKIVEGYHGNVSVSSVPGNTCFVVQLPKEA